MGDSLGFYSPCSTLATNRLAEALNARDSFSTTLRVGDFRPHSISFPYGVGPWTTIAAPLMT
jgi:hypothetical protein